MGIGCYGPPAAFRHMVFFVILLDSAFLIWLIWVCMRVGLLCFTSIMGEPTETEFTPHVGSVYVAMMFFIYVLHSGKKTNSAQLAAWWRWKEIHRKEMERSTNIFRRVLALARLALRQSKQDVCISILGFALPWRDTQSIQEHV